ncbi:MAG TPA: hypothetical protein VGW78_02370 [Candidatus Babeliales bacterium]|jgi:hypothetical protein|nr:hypothetical protein [Candidatus Babeliales bacterium]
MKYSRYYIPIIATLLPISAYAATFSSIKSAINQASQEVFDAPLYQKPFSESNAMPWIEAVTKAGVFVSDNRNNFNDKTLRDLYTEIKGVHDTLIKTIQDTYNVLFKPKEVNPELVKKQEAVFEKMQTTLRGIENSINAIDKFVIPQKEEVRQLLLLLTIALKNNASKALNQMTEEADIRTHIQTMELKEKKEAKKEKVQEEQTRKDEEQKKQQADAQAKAQELKNAIITSNSLFANPIFVSSFSAHEIEFILDNITKFVKMYAYDESTLLQARAALTDTYYNFLESIATIYRKIVSQPSESVSEKSYQTALQDLEAYKSIAQDTLNKLNKVSFDGPQEEVRIVLRTLASSLKTNITQAQDQLEREMNKRKKELETQQKAKAASKNIEPEAAQIKRSFIAANKKIFDKNLYQEQIKDIFEMQNQLKNLNTFVQKYQNDQKILGELSTALSKISPRTIESINIIFSYLPRVTKTEGQKDIAKQKIILQQMQQDIQDIMNRLQKDKFESEQEVIRVLLFDMGTILKDNITKAIDSLEILIKTRLEEAIKKIEADKQKITTKIEKEKQETERILSQGEKKIPEQKPTSPSKVDEEVERLIKEAEAEAEIEFNAFMQKSATKPMTEQALENLAREAGLSEEEYAQMVEEIQLKKEIDEAIPPKTKATAKTSTIPTPPPAPAVKKTVVKPTGRGRY